jgi:hypothetical protein
LIFEKNYEIKKEKKKIKKNKIMTTVADWKNLPSLALEKIFTKLDLNDRYESSLVCSNWQSNYMNSKKLSSHLNLNITYSPLLIHLQKLLENYIAKFGKCIKYLKISIDCPDLTDLGKYLLNFSLVSLFKSLHNDSIKYNQLIEFEIINIKITNLPQFITGDIEMIHAIKQYLKTQKKLKHFSIKNCDVPDEITFSIADIVLQNCHTSIETLKLCRIFEKFETFQELKFIKLFDNLSNLKLLEIDYHYVSKDLIVRLVECSANFSFLKLYIHSFIMKNDNSIEVNKNLAYYNRYILTAQTWAYVYSKLPKLQVTFVYEDCGLEFINLFQFTINNELRLRHLYIKWAYIRMNFFKSQFSLISTSFVHTLRTLDISLFIKSIFDIQCLFDFIELAAKQIEIIMFKFDTDDLTLIEYSLFKFKAIMDKLKYETCYLKNLIKFHLCIDISSIGESVLIEFRKLFEKINFKFNTKFCSKSKFLITILNFSSKTEFSIEN